MSLESLKEDIQQQIKIVQSSKSQISKLEQYCDEMNYLAYMIDGQWSGNLDRDNFMFHVLINVETAGQILYDYSSFSIQALGILNTIGQLESLGKLIIPGEAHKKKAYKDPYSINCAERAKIKLKHGGLDLYLQELKKSTTLIDEIHLETTSLNSRIDSFIIEKLASRYSLKGINKRIDELAKSTQKLEKSIENISDIYKKNENNLQKMVVSIADNGKSSGQVDAAVQKTFSEYKKKTTENTKWPEKKTYKIIDLTDSVIYEHQSPGDQKCYKVSTINLMRRKAIIDGDPNWASVNQDNYSDAVTTDGIEVREKVKYKNSAGQYELFSVGGEDVDVLYGEGPYPPVGKGFKYLSNDEKVIRIKALLDNHPEGIALLSTTLPTVTGGWHSILLTDYEVRADGSLQFYCSDPAKSNGARIRLEESYYYSNGDSVSDMIGRASNYKACYKVG